MPRRRAAWITAAVGVTLLGLAGYVVFSLRECQDFSNVRRGSVSFRLCGMGRETIAAVPVIAPVGDVGYSRRMQDGMKPTVMGLTYESAAATDAIRASLTAFLSAKGFALALREDRYEWWSDPHGRIGFWIHAESGKDLVDVIHLPADE